MFRPLIIVFSCLLLIGAGTAVRAGIIDEVVATRQFEEKKSKLGKRQLQQLELQQKRLEVRQAREEQRRLQAQVRLEKEEARKQAFAEARAAKEAEKQAREQARLDARLVKEEQRRARIEAERLAKQSKQASVPDEPQDERFSRFPTFAEPASFQPEADMPQQAIEAEPQPQADPTTTVHQEWDETIDNWLDTDEGTRPAPRQEVVFETREAPGTIIIDTKVRHLYYVLGDNRAIQYGIGVGRPGFTWMGVKSVMRKEEWPDWRPPDMMIARRPDLPRFMPGGPANPLGARAMYLGGTLYRIHGSNEPETIGHAVSSGCFRMVNADVIDLYSRTQVGTKVIVQ